MTIGDASEQSAATFGRAVKRGADYGMLNANGAAFINAEIIGALTSGKASATSIATTTSAAYVKIEAYYKLLYTQATLQYAHSIDEAIEHEDADEMAEMIGEGYAFWRTLRPWVKAWDSGKADIIDDIYDTPKASRRTVHCRAPTITPTATSRRSSTSSSRRFLPAFRPTTAPTTRLKTPSASRVAAAALSRTQLQHHH